VLQINNYLAGYYVTVRVGVVFLEMTCDGESSNDSSYKQWIIQSEIQIFFQH
jgi:hypothetical protein